MNPTILQVGEAYILPVNSKIIVREMGVSTRYTMLIKGGAVIVREALQDTNVTTYNLLWKLIDDITPLSGNKVYVNISKTAQSLGVSIKTVYRVLSVLVDRGIIYKAKRAQYLINPSIVWSGKTVDRAEALIYWEQEVINASDCK